MINMWTADYLSYKGNTNYIAAYRGAELVWQKPIEDTTNYFYLQNRDETEAGDVYLMNWAADEKSWTTGYYTSLKSDKNIEQRPSLQYSFDKRKWVDWEIVDDLENNTRNTRYKPINLQPQQKVYLRGNNNGSLSYIINGVLYFSQFDATVNFAAGGDVWSILANDQWDNTKKTVGKYGLSGLFWNNLKIVDVSDLSLESINYAGYGCYNKMFLYCDNITATPKLSKHTHLADYCYAYMFYHCDNLENIQLDSFNSESRDYCYFNMFYWCYKVTRVPALPAAFLATGCYENMLAHTGITEIPELTSTSLASRCYYQMFIRCDKLTSIPSLPATTIPERAYYGMFAQCYNLEQVGEIMANKLMGSGSCQSMFDSTKKLKEVPVFAHITESSIANTVNAFGGLMYSSMVEDIDLQKAFPNLHSLASSRMVFADMFAYCDNIKSIKLFGADVELGEQCYESMFRECELTVVPELPAMTMKRNCYNGMFKNCETLTTAPVLPATTLEYGCYQNMFHSCKALTTAPALPATTLAEYCYGSMFSQCKALTSAPILPAEHVVKSAYYQMFWSCNNLNYIECHATSFDDSPMYNWTYNVAATGTFVKDYAAEFTTGTSGIPTGWTIINANEPTKTYTATFKNYDGTVLETLTLEAGQTPTYSGAEPTKPSTDEFEYKFIGWSPEIGPIENDMEYIAQFEEIAIPQVDPADDLYNPYVTFRAETISPYKDSEGRNYCRIRIISKSDAHVLQYSFDKDTWTELNETDAIMLYNIGDEVYIRGYINSPSRYNSTNYTRFEIKKDYGRVSAHGNACALWNYPDMVDGDENDWTTKQYCGYNMFYSCNGLEKAPVLPAKNFMSHCYDSMFEGCTSLNEIVCLSTGGPNELPLYNNNSTLYWLYNTSSTGTFYKSPNTIVEGEEGAERYMWPIGDNGIPSGWTVLDYTA